MLDILLDPLSYNFMQRAFLIGSVIAIAAGLLSCWLILLGWSLLGDAVSHSVLPGVVIAYILGWPFAVGAFIAALLTVTLVGNIREKTTLKQDTAIGIIFTSLFALGLVLISVTPSDTNLQHILFGNLLGVSGDSVLQVVIFSLCAIIILLVFRKNFTLWAFDASQARMLQLNTTLIRWGLLISLALVVVASMQAVGVILVVAMLVTPGATAYLLTQRFSIMFIISPIVALVSVITGLYLSFYLDISSGGTIVLVQGALFALVYVCGRREGILWSFVRKHHSAR